MARTRGGLSSHRKKRVPHKEDAVEDHAFKEHDTQQEEEHEDVAEGGFPGGPVDASVLTHYIHHVAYAIWHSRGLLLAFVERFHFETSSFHLSMGEIFVTLDDVSSLLHLPILGQLCHLKEVDFEESRCAIVELLGVDSERVSVELHVAHGVKVILSWLREIYIEHCEQ
ncbi:protein MAINTENANCE OF MERISTEMS-like [Vigna angularis]|uniref:protein MAINTENANCE OF MERISTEMS-like n=1 Tax=Phaseolus angularis TaxID=3914 RepID=UPI00080A27D8|nr:protein MAINTENANCE OF MERISTEMS-like [Vigna angularis]